MLQHATLLRKKEHSSSLVMLLAVNSYMAIVGKTSPKCLNLVFFEEALISLSIPAPPSNLLSLSLMQVGHEFFAIGRPKITIHIKRSCMLFCSSKNIHIIHRWLVFLFSALILDPRGV
jgi:hypothetical protein